MKTYHYKSCGLPNVILQGGFDVIETEYGEAVSIRDLEGLHKVLGHVIANKKQLLNKHEIRFLRKEMELTQSELAIWLGVKEPTIRSWESGRSKISLSSEKLLRVMYSEHAEGRVNVREMLDEIKQLHDDVSLDIELTFEAADEKWLPSQTAA